MHQSVSKQ